MTDIKAHVVFETFMQKVELHRLVELLAKNGVISRVAAMSYFVDLAEFCRAPENDQYLPLTDLKARHYEDMAAKVGGGHILSRDANEPPQQ